MAGLTQLDLDGQKLLAAPGRARNVLIIALEGIPDAYLGVNRQALHSSYQENLMPNLSRWAERGMNTPDYVLTAIKPFVACTQCSAVITTCSTTAPPRASRC